jgi:hypothetical protein
MNTEREVVQHALEWYLSDLRQEIVKTEKYDMRRRLHHEADILRNFIHQLDSQTTESACPSM